MDNEYDLLSKDNEKYSIKIADYKARLKAIEKELHKEILTVHLAFIILNKTKYQILDSKIE
jgi:hypothetical protein